MGEETREKILKAAEELFFTKGYDATGIREIAAKAGVNSSMISYYFGGKRELFRELLLSHMDTMEREVSKITTNDPERFIREFVRIHIRTLRLRGPRLAVMMMRELHAKSDVGSELLERFLKSIGDRLTEVIRNGIEKGTFRRLEPRLILNFLIHTDAMVAIGFQNMGLEEASETAFSLFMDGVRG